MNDKGTILVVDDTHASLKLLTDILESEGYKVRPADSGELALMSITASPPALILLDIQMPDMDGLEVYRQLKTRQESRIIPVIFISASTDTEKRLEGLRLGAVDFISKPFQREELLARVQTHLELGQLRAHLEETVAERTAELQSANLALEKASRAKDEFLGMMSHELRTPLTGILGLAQVLQLNSYGALNEKQLKAIQKIEQSGQRLNTLVNSILNYSMLQSGTQQLNIQSFPLIGVCKSSLKKFEKLAADRQQTLHFNIASLAIIVKADENALSQILDNLLSNALKFTPPGGRIDLNISGLTVTRQVRITVSDTGIGIQETDILRLFKPFHQLDARLSRQYEGAGMGLALVKLLAELHGGSVEVESVFGQGSRFTVLLPWLSDESQ